MGGNHGGFEELCLVSNTINKLKNALDMDIPIEVRTALLDAIHQIRRCNEHNSELKKYIAELNAKHSAVSSAVRNCIKLLDGERKIVSRR